jgi:hypothetical protein
LKPVSHFIGARVETGRVSSCGSKRFIQLVQPHRVQLALVHLVDLPHAVAAQVAFGNQTLKPVFHFVGSRLETRRFQAMGQLDSRICAAPPRRRRAWTWWQRAWRRTLYPRSWRRRRIPRVGLVAGVQYQVGYHFSLTTLLLQSKHGHQLMTASASMVRVINRMTRNQSDTRE